MNTFDYDTAKVGDEVAIDQSPRYISYRFGEIVRVSKAFIEVKARDDLVKFSRATHKPLGQPSFNDRYRLVTAEHAKDVVERERARQEIVAERREISEEMRSLSDNSWDAEMVAKLRALADRIEKAIG